MRKSFHLSAIAALVVSVVLSASSSRAADDYEMDPAHTGVVFKISHLGLSWTYGRFNEVSGTFAIDPAAPEKCAFNLNIKTDSIDTAIKARDQHLMGPDFFNGKQYPAISFKSTAVKAVKDGYEVTGNMTMHGQTKPIAMTLVGGVKAEMPKGVKRTGYTTELVLKRSEFGMDKMLEAIGNEVYISISFEGIKK